MITFVLFDAGRLVDAVKVALVTPDGTVTLVGTQATGSLLDTATFTPPGGAAALRVTVPVEVNPPRTVLGLMLTDTSAGGGMTVSAADRVTAKS
jgi:hypothetical protein